MLLGYARVSTIKHEIETQIQRLKDVGVDKIFSDVISGKRFDRPGLSEMLAFAREGDVVCVVRLDRLGRSMKDLLGIIDKFQQHKIAFNSLEEKLDTTSAAGSLIFHVFAALADFERRLIAERTRDGLAAAMARGNMPGRPRIDPSRIEHAKGLIALGHTKASAARAVGISRVTLLRRLKQG